MRKLMFVLAAMAAVLLVASPTMEASAQMTRGMAAIKTATQNFTPKKKKKAACFGWGRCRPGFHRVCGPRRCWCAPC